MYSDSGGCTRNEMLCYVMSCVERDEEEEGQNAIVYSSNGVYTPA